MIGAVPGLFRNARRSLNGNEREFRTKRYGGLGWTPEGAGYVYAVGLFYYTVRRDSRTFIDPATIRVFAVPSSPLPSVFLFG